MTFKSVWLNRTRPCTAHRRLNYPLKFNSGFIVIVPEPRRVCSFEYFTLQEMQYVISCVVRKRGLRVILSFPSGKWEHPGSSIGCFLLPGRPLFLLNVSKEAVNLDLLQTFNFQNLILLPLGPRMFVISISINPCVCVCACLCFYSWGLAKIWCILPILAFHTAAEKMLNMTPCGSISATRRAFCKKMSGEKHSHRRFIFLLKTPVEKCRPLRMCTYLL